VEQNRDIKRANRFFGNNAQLEYLEMTVRSQNSIQEEIKRVMLVTIQSKLCLLVPCLKTQKITIYKTIIFLVVLYGCEN
jgi:hypothetical protein